MGRPLILLYMRFHLLVPPFPRRSPESFWVCAPAAGDPVHVCLPSPRESGEIEADQLLWGPGEALESAVGRRGGGSWHWILEDAVPRGCLGQREERGFLGLKKLQLHSPNPAAFTSIRRSADKTSSWNSPKKPPNTPEKNIASPESRSDRPFLPPRPLRVQTEPGGGRGRTEANGQGTGRSAESRTLQPHPFLPARSCCHS